MTPRTRLVALGALLLAVALGGVAHAALNGFAPVYPVSDVATGLRQDPQAWVGRTIMVWGWDIRLGWPCAGGTVATRGASCPQGAIERLLPARRPFTFAAQRAGWTSYAPPGGVWLGVGRAGDRRGLLVTRRPGAQVPVPNEPNGALLRLAQLPVVGALVPSRLLERGAVYRVRLLDTTRCASPPCPEGVLQ